MGGDEDSSNAASGRKTFWRSASWSSSRTSLPEADGGENNPSNGPFRRFPVPLTPRSQSKARPCLPPLQPLSITRRSLDEWPMAGSDDVGEWPQPPTPSSRPNVPKPGEGLKLDLSSLRTQVKKDQIAFFDKECSKVADHIYLGGDSVAKNREILRQNGITHVLNCVGFVCPEYFKSDLVYKTLWLQDNPTEDITSILYDVFDYFEDVREQGGRVFVHCCQGVSRSTSLVIAYLMWRKGQSFDDAFQFVKAARSIANPNMGFACQLLQCQKRVHAIPLSPNSVLRMYRMAPHSSYDPLHLVPKMLNDPSPAALDSRGAFIVHVLSSIYIWIGKYCDQMMEKDAKAAAFQVVRYERVQGPVLTVKEGDEPVEFWEAFTSAPLADSRTKVNKDDIELATKIGAGKRRVDLYDVDFELFYKAITGGVVPPFSTSGPGQETHLPARESNWSVLRRKFIAGAISRVFSDAVLVKDSNTHANRVQLLSMESSASPPYLSPSSLTSDTSSNSKGSSDSPSFSPPSTSSSPSLTPSLASSNLPNYLASSSRPSFHMSGCSEPLKLGMEVKCSPSKGSTHSIAERRGGFSPLKLPSLQKDASLVSRNLTFASPPYAESLDDDLGSKGSKNGSQSPANDSSNITRSIDNVSDLDGKLVLHSSRNCLDAQDGQLLPSLTGFVDDASKFADTLKPIAYHWPSMERINTLGREDLDSKGVFLFLIPTAGRKDGFDKELTLWIGSFYGQAKKQTQQSRDDKIAELDWNLVATDFLASMGLPDNIPVKVLKEREPEEFLQLFHSP